MYSEPAEVSRQEDGAKAATDADQASEAAKPAQTPPGEAAIPERPSEAKPQVAKAKTSAGIEKQAPPPRRVLVIEDSMPLRRMLCKILQTQSFQCFEAADGKSALQLLEQMTPSVFSLIVTDLMMPNMDGASFIAAARKEYGPSLPPVLICSSRSDREAVQVVMSLGVSGYILKPFKTETVINKIRAVLSDGGDSKE